MAISIIGTPQGGGATNGGNVTLTFDVAPQQNDYVLVWGGYSVDASNDFTPAPGPSTAGYTPIKQITAAAPGFYVGYKKMGASPDANVVCQGSADTGCASSYGCVVLRGVDQTTFEDAAATETGPTSGVPDGPASSTSVTLNAMCVVAAGCQVNDTSKGTVANFTPLADGSGNDTVAFSAAAQYRILDTLRSENPGAWSSWSSGTYRAVTILVRPAVTVVTEDNQETVTLTEAHAERVSKTRGDSLSFTEGFTALRVVQKALSDTLSFVEGLAKQMNNVVGETVAFTESQLITVAKTRADTDRKSVV